MNWKQTIVNLKKAKLLQIFFFIFFFCMCFYSNQEMKIERDAKEDIEPINKLMKTRSEKWLVINYNKFEDKLKKRFWIYGSLLLCIFLFFSFSWFCFVRNMSLSHKMFSIKQCYELLQTTINQRIKRKFYKIFFPHSYHFLLGWL